MRYKIFSLIISLVALIAVVQVTSASTRNLNAEEKTLPSVNPSIFYYKPTYNRFLEIMNAFAQTPRDPLNDENYAIFAAVAMENNKQLLKSVLNNFSSYSDRAKILIAEAFMTMNDQDALNKTAGYYDNNQVSVPKYFINKLETLSIDNDAHNLDILWNAYFASGNKAYIKNILTFINQDDYLLIVGYEIVNRNYICEVRRKLEKNPECPRLEDLKKSVKKHYPDQAKEKFLQATVISAAVWSLNANANDDPVLKKNIQEIISANPQLDYWSKIDKALKG